MKHARAAVLAATALALPLTLSGCGSNGSSPEKTSKPANVGVAVPAPLKTQGMIRVGVACDYPPFGYKDMEGKNAGYDPEVARSLAKYAFGDSSKVAFTCVTPQNRIPYLNTKKIDLIISTLGYTLDRVKIIDYSVPYFRSGVKLLVPKDSTISGWADVKGQTMITKEGTTASIYLKNCYPQSKQLLLTSTSDAVAALKAHRGAAFAEDSTLLLGLSLSDSSLKVVGEDKAETPWGLGIRKGDSDTKKWVDAVLVDMQAKDTFWKIFTSQVSNKDAAKTFAKNMPRPGQDITYTNQNTLTQCS